MSTYSQLSTNLIASMLKMEVNKIEGKMEVMEICRTLMPEGRPDYLSVIKYPMIKDLVKEKGNNIMHKVLLLLVKDFCNTMNVVRNMNEDQMIEAAGMLLDECDNFRLEDYVMMFQMAKKGQLVKIMDRIDLQMITAMLDEYWAKRNEIGQKELTEETNYLDSLGNSEKLMQTICLQDAKLMDAASGFATEINKIKDLVETKVGNREERQKLKQIEIEDVEKIRRQLKERGFDHYEDPNISDDN